MKTLLKDYGKVIVLVSGILVSVLLMMESFIVSNADEATMGIDIIFGTESTFLGMTAKFKFNILLFLALLLPSLVGIIGVFLDTKSGAIIGLLGFVISIFILLITNDTTYELTVLGVTITENISISLTVMGWLAVGFLGLGALSNLGLLIEK